MTQHILGMWQMAFMWMCLSLPIGFKKCKWGSRSENSGLLLSTGIWGEVAWIRELKQGALLMAALELCCPW